MQDIKSKYDIILEAKARLEDEVDSLQSKMDLLCKWLLITYEGMGEFVFPHMLLCMHRTFTVASVRKPLVLNVDRFSYMHIL